MPAKVWLLHNLRSLEHVSLVTRMFFVPIVNLGTPAQVTTDAPNAQIKQLTLLGLDSSL